MIRNILKAARRKHEENDIGRFFKIYSLVILTIGTPFALLAWMVDTTNIPAIVFGVVSVISGTLSLIFYKGDRLLPAKLERIMVADPLEQKPTKKNTSLCMICNKEEKSKYSSDYCDTCLDEL